MSPMGVWFSAMISRLTPNARREAVCSFTRSWIAVLMITDLLGRKYRFNIPGTSDRGNWTRRLSSTVAEFRKSRETHQRMKLIGNLLKKNGRT